MARFNTFERWLISANVVLSISMLIYFKDFSWIAWISLAASISNTFCVVLVAKRRISNFWFGAFAVMAYGIVAFKYGNTGEWQLNWLYYFPMNIISWILWRKNANKRLDRRPEEEEVASKSLNIWQSLAVYTFAIGMIIVYARLIELPSVNNWFYGKLSPFGFDKFLTDSTTNVLSIIAMFLMAWRYREQWILWIVIDIVSIFLWSYYTFEPIMIVMWSTMLVNAIYGYTKWRTR